MERKFKGVKLKVEENNLKEILELMVNKNYSNLSATYVEGLINILVLKEQNFSKVRELDKEFSFDKLVREICNKCSFKYPYKYPQDGKVIWSIGSLQYTFLVNFLPLDSNGRRLEFIKV